MMQRRLSAAALVACVVMTSTVMASAVTANTVTGADTPSQMAEAPAVVTQLAQVQEPPDEWVSVSELPPEDRLPAAPLLIGAYAFVLAVLFTYVTLVARRLTGLQRDIARLEATIGRDGKG